MFQSAENDQLILWLCASMNMKNHRRGPNIHFYRVGIGDKTMLNSRGWQLMSFEELTRKFNDTNVRSVYFKLKYNLYITGFTMYRYVTL